jgi:hypothetical protein
MEPYSTMELNGHHLLLRIKSNTLNAARVTRESQHRLRLAYRPHVDLSILSASRNNLIRFSPDGSAANSRRVRGEFLELKGA